MHIIGSAKSLAAIGDAIMTEVLTRNPEGRPSRPKEIVELTSYPGIWIVDGTYCTTEVKDMWLSRIT